MNGWSGAAIVALAGVVVLRGMWKGCDVYGAFLAGAEKGMLALVNASGLTALLTSVISPLTGARGLPPEIAPMLRLRPLTGSGSLAALEAVFENCGVDSRAGRIASVLMGSSETIFYTMTVYLGAAGVKRLPRVLPVSLAAYFLCAALCGWIM